jgi:hypothetical protein
MTATSASMRTASPEPQLAAARHSEYTFAILIAIFCAIYLAWYPVSYSILDESSTLSLSYAIAHGTIYLDQVNLNAGLRINRHIVSLYSPFHAELLALCMKLNWRLGFAVTAGFFILGAFIVRDLLIKSEISPAWSILYFLNPGALYYSQTLMAAVPAATMGLWGVAMLMRPAPRLILAGLFLGCAVLLHPWMGPFVSVFGTIWLLEQGWDGLAERFAKLAAGAMPAIALLALYNFLITGSPLHPAYWVLGDQHNFDGRYFGSFAPFYLISLVFFPIAGIAVLAPRWSGGWALSIASAVTILLASLYYYRDGLNLQGHSIAHVLAGAIPGQRFLLPISFVACVPAARFLDAIFRELLYRWRTHLVAFGCASFAVGFAPISMVHQEYLRAHAALQQAMVSAVPVGAEIVEVTPFTSAFHGCKEFAPVQGIRHCIERDAAGTTIPPEAYVMWMGPPGAIPPERWFNNHQAHRIQARSMLWNVDVWLTKPRVQAQAQNKDASPGSGWAR